MVITFHHKHFHIVVHRRFWLIVAAVITFLLVALWSKPIG